MKNTRHFFLNDSIVQEEHKIHVDDIFLIEDTDYDGKANIYLKSGECVMVDKSQELSLLIKQCRKIGWKKGFGQYNSSPQANSVPCEDGKSFVSYHDPKCVVAEKSNGVNYLYSQSVLFNKC